MVGWYLLETNHGFLHELFFMANQPTPPNAPPLEIRVLIAGLIKGNQCLINFISPDHKAIVSREIYISKRFSKHDKAAFKSQCCFLQSGFELVVAGAYDRLMFWMPSEAQNCFNGNLRGAQ